jgi:hypothetical protein
MPNLRSDIVGRVNRLPLRANEKNALFPVMEAISNSIHSITDLYDRDASTKGRIVIRVLRDTDDSAKHVIGFDVEDNGVGFTDENYRSFQTPDSRLKEKRGGKGVGRLAWLKVFQSISIESTYSNGSSWAQRCFDFRLSERDQIVERSPSDTPTDYRTVVRFRGFNPDFESRRPVKRERLFS